MLHTNIISCSAPKWVTEKRNLKFLGPKGEHDSVVPAFLTVGSGANSFTVTLGNIHCIQRLIFPLVPPMLLVFCSRVTVSANGPSSPAGTESPCRDKTGSAQRAGPVWCSGTFETSFASQWSSVERRGEERSSHFIVGGFGKDLRVTALGGLFKIYFLSTFPVNLFSKQVSVRFLRRVKNK